MRRKVVYRAVTGSDEPVFVCVNNEIGLEPFCDYDIPEYLCDLEIYENMRLICQDGKLFTFEGGRSMLLEERVEPIEVNELDSETLLAVLTSAVSG